LVATGNGGIVGAGTEVEVEALVVGALVDVAAEFANVREGESKEQAEPMNKTTTSKIYNLFFPSLLLDVVIFSSQLE